MKYQDPKNDAPIDYLYVVLSHDNNGNEGICSIITPGFGATPLVFNNKSTIEQLRPRIEEAARNTDKTLRLCKFEKIEVLEEICSRH